MMVQKFLKSLFYSLILVFLFSPALKAQKEAASITAKNAVFLELGGNAAYYSLNYERIFQQKGALKWAARAGLSVVPTNLQSKSYLGIILPIEIIAIYGGSKHHLEAGAGVSPYLFPYTDINSWEIDYEGHKPGVIIPFRIGYRYQKPEGGFFFRLGYTPFIVFHSQVKNRSTFTWLHGGLSVGKSF